MTKNKKIMAGLASASVAAFISFYPMYRGPIESSEYNLMREKIGLACANYSSESGISAIEITGENPFIRGIAILGRDRKEANNLSKIFIAGVNSNLSRMNLDARLGRPILAEINVKGSSKKSGAGIIMLKAGRKGLLPSWIKKDQQVRALQKQDLYLEITPPKLPAPPRYDLAALSRNLPTRARTRTFMHQHSGRRKK